MGQRQGSCCCIQAADAVDEIGAVVEEPNVNGAATTVVGSVRKQISLDDQIEFHSEAPVEDAEELISILEQVPLFMQLSSEQHTTLASAFTTLQYKEGETLYKRGDEGNEFFIIARGTVSLVEKGETSTLSKGDWVGLSALSRRTVRRATLTAESDVEVLALKRAAFRRIGLYQNMNIVKKHDIVEHTNRSSTIATQAPSVKSTSDVKIIQAALKANKNLNTFYELDDSMIDSLAELAWEQVVEEDCELITVANTDVDYFYIVKTGNFEVYSLSDNNCDNSFTASTLSKNNNFAGRSVAPLSLDHFDHSMTASRVMCPTASTGTINGPVGMSLVSADFRSLMAADFSRPSVHALDHRDSRRSQGVGLSEFVGAGGSFGETALHYFANQALTVIAREESVVWVIDRATFQGALVKSGDNSVKFAEYLQRGEAFMDLQLAEKMEIARNLNDASFAKGEHITEQNTKRDTFHILIEGTVKFVKDGRELKRFQAAENDVLIFGEQVLLDKEESLCPETVTVVSETAKTIHMSKASFELLLAPLAQLQARGLKGRCTVKSRKTLMKCRNSRQAAQKILRKDLTVLGRLGCGGFGIVDLVEHKFTKKTYAFKAVSKGFLCIQQQQHLILDEARIHRMCYSPFIVRVYETFNDKNNLLFLLELMLGGTVLRAYVQHELHGSVAHCQYYVASCVYALAHMHELNIIFRDLKPENMLLGSSGHMKLADFGLAKVSVGKTYTTCGTPYYNAPEVCAGTGHTHAVDWWALGVITFELMTGTLPFNAASSMIIFARVKKGFDQVTFPPDMDMQCVDFVRGMSNLSPTERIPMKKGGNDNIKNHVWCKDFNWKGLLDDTVTPPYKPVVTNRRDLANFDANEDEAPWETIDYSIYDDGSNWDADFATSE